MDVVIDHLRFEARKWEDKDIDEGNIMQNKPRVSVESFSNISYLTVSQVPIQPNNCDCGFYIIHFFDLIVSDPPKYRQILRVSICDID
jgi:hypothetical protein